MRSRFTAYALNNTQYVQDTSDSVIRPKPEEMNFGGENITWKRLDVIDKKKGTATDSKGIVEFKAYYVKNNEDNMLHETSRFIKNGGLWFYLDGVVKSVGKIIPQQSEGKNAPCLCGSGKKFKRCCGKGD